MSRVAAVLSALCLTACVTTHDGVETGPDGASCIDPNLIARKQYWEENHNRYETAVIMSFSLPGYTSDAARVSYTLYLSDQVVTALRDYAAAHPRAVTPAAGGLEKVDGWYDPVRSTLRHPVLLSAPRRGWFLVEPGLLDAKGEGGFFLECKAQDGGQCIRHYVVAGRSVEVAMSEADQEHWADADAALRTALQSLLAPCIP